MIRTSEIPLNETKDCDGFTPVMFAMTCTIQNDALKYLIKESSPLEQKLLANDMNLLQLAILYHREPAVIYLIKNYAFDL